MRKLSPVRGLFLACIGTMGIAYSACYYETTTTFCHGDGEVMTTREMPGCGDPQVIVVGTCYGSGITEDYMPGQTPRTNFKQKACDCSVKA